MDGLHYITQFHIIIPSTIIREIALMAEQSCSAGNAHTVLYGYHVRVACIYPHIVTNETTLSNLAAHPTQDKRT